MNVHVDRFMKRMDQINRIGRTEEGITRLSLSPEDMEARKTLSEMCLELGMKVIEDGVGNIWARLEGRDAQLPAVVIGSHIDTVPNGGAFDGTLGVLAGVECIQMMQENKFVPLHPVEIVSFSTEESSRFNISTVGSKIVTGQMKPTELHSYKDSDGTSLFDELERNGFNPLRARMIPAASIKAFLELHIEQGPVLERSASQIGLVTEIAAPTRLIITITGENAHTGACPMPYRKDALVAASLIIAEVEAIGLKESSNNIVATVGKLDIYPNSINVVPGKVKIYVDIRGVDTVSIARTLNSIIESTNRVSRDRKIKETIDILCQEEPISMNPELVDGIEAVCKELGFSYAHLPSGAGHNAMDMAQVVPSAMIFTPCIGGISHDKDEDMHIEDISNALEVLYRTVCLLAQ